MKNKTKQKTTKKTKPKQNKMLKGISIRAV